MPSVPRDGPPVPPPAARGAWDGQRVAALRAHLGWTQAELAAWLGMRQQTISEWEVGRYAPRRASGVLLGLLAAQAGFVDRAPEVETWQTGGAGHVGAERD